MTSKTEVLLLRTCSALIKYLVVAWEEVQCVKHSDELSDDEKISIKFSYQNELMQVLKDIHEEIKKNNDNTE